jgi:hypothetical protein
LVRDKVWQGYAHDPQAFSGFQSYPFGKMVLKYNPVLVNSGGMIVTKTYVDGQFHADEAEKDRFASDLPAQFASLQTEEREARQVENDAQYGSKYHQPHRTEVLTALAHGAG